MSVHRTSRWWLIAISILVIIAFVGCDMAGYDITQVEEASRKAKTPPAPITIVSDPAPTIYWGTEGDLVLDPIIGTYEYLADHVYLTVGQDGIADPAFNLFDEEGTVTHEYVGYRFLGYLSGGFGFWAGQHNDAGAVTISNDGENFFIEIDTNGLADVQEFHIYAYASASALPTKRPAPGQAPFKLENVNSDSVTATIPLDYFGATAEMAGSYYFIIHAALVGDAEASGGTASLAGETAYAAGNDTPSFNGKGSWFYVVGYTVKPMYELIYKPVEINDDDGDSFPAWGQAISNVTLIFDTAAGDTPVNNRDDGYYTVKFDGFAGSDSRDLDDMIGGILDYLALNDPVVSTYDPVFLGAVIKGGLQITRYFEFGTGDNEPDELPEGIAFSLNGTKDNVEPTSAIDVSYDYGSVR